MSRCGLLTSAGVTRESTIQLARKLAYDVIEEPVSIHEAMEADEVFTTGNNTCC
jgi:branched-chain amino acid aminotransferase